MAATPRHAFDEQLASLQGDVVRMGGLAAEALGLALQQLTGQDHELAARVLDIENQIDALNLDIESRALQLLARQQPMARDLRIIAAVLRIITDVERIGDYSVDTSKQAQRLAAAPRCELPPEIPHMGAVVQQMLGESLQAFVRHDLQLARRAAARDDEVDHDYHQLYDRLVELLHGDPGQAEAVACLLLISAYLERMADHVTNIDERVWFMETGELQELHE